MFGLAFWKVADILEPLLVLDREYLRRRRAVDADGHLAAAPLPAECELLLEQAAAPSPSAATAATAANVRPPGRR